MIELVQRLREYGAGSIRLACTHGLFSSDALERLSALEDVAEIVCTNTVPITVPSSAAKLKILSVAPALAEAIQRIHNGQSVSALF
jgi:ribose-phosphate pyrophosphokinase